MFEDPMQFDIKKKIGNVEVEYSGLMEICQGGPEVGHVSINGKLMEGRFGGPALLHDDDIYLPVYLKKFLGTGFKLVKINAVTFKCEIFGGLKKLIFLDRIEAGRIYFFEDMNKTIQTYYEQK